MADTHEPFSLDVGGKLLLLALLLIVFGVLAVILLPVMSMFAPSPAPESGGMIGAAMPGIILLIVGLLLGAIAGLCLGYAKKKYPDTH